MPFESLLPTRGRTPGLQARAPCLAEVQPANPGEALRLTFRVTGGDPGSGMVHKAPRAAARCWSTDSAASGQERCPVQVPTHFRTVTLLLGSDHAREASPPLRPPGPALDGIQ